LHASLSGSIVAYLLAIPFFSLNWHLCGPKSGQAAEVFRKRFFPGTTRAVGRGTEAARSVEKAPRFEAVPLIFMKYQELNGASPFFWLEPKRYPRTHAGQIIEMCQVS